MEYLFKNYKGSNKEKLVQIARISVIIFTSVFCLMFRENNNLFNLGDYAVTIVDSDEYKGKYYSGVVMTYDRKRTGKFLFPVLFFCFSFKTIIVRDKYGCV